jgi:MHS family citrate/tricarballylate:H+ symporter-like MFS transporter
VDSQLEAAPRKRHVFAIVAGNALEFYDFLTFSYFSIYIGQAFFPSHDKMLSLLASLATFGVGFATRPIGAVVIGSWGDRNGRKPAMVFCFAVMGLVILALALTPSYASIGVAAPIVVVSLRLIQGFALGGAVGPTTAILIESAPENRRGLYGALQAGSQFASTFFAGVVGFVLTGAMAPDAFAAYGWRIAMLIGTLVVPVGLLLMRDMPETVHAHGENEPDRGALIKSNMRVMVLGFVILATATIGVYELLFIPTYAMQILGMPAQSTFGATMVVGLAGALLAPFTGLASDIYGRKTVFMSLAVLTLLLVLPGFLVLDHFRNAVALLGVALVLSACHASGGAVAIMAIPEAMPPAVRSGANATVYALAIAAFGGTAQFNIAWLIKHTGDNLAPAYYWMGAALIGLIAMALFPETAPAVLKRRAAK